MRLLLGFFLFFWGGKIDLGVNLLPPSCAAKRENNWNKHQELQNLWTAGETSVLFSL